jgi:pantoate--beta-alanine ligase
MKKFQNPEELSLHLRRLRSEGKRLGLVPTMGALHEGHLSLVRTSRKENDITIVTIFVNPLQFNNPGDLKNYPRTLEKDIEKLEGEGCDVLFNPNPDFIYSEQPVLSMNFGKLEEVMEGKFRPGHFNGVAIIVAKLFHYCLPDNAYFGLKDLQQFRIISQMVKDLSFPVRLTGCPTYREKDGLAMSSRNLRLDPESREKASLIFQSLLLAKNILWKEGIELTKEKIKDFYEKVPGFTLEYFEIADAETLQPVSEVSKSKEVAFCIAAWIGGVRLIDNLISREDE